MNTNIPKKEQNIVFLGQFCEVSQMANRCIFSFGDVQKKVGEKKTYATFHIVSNCGEILGGLRIFCNLLFCKFSFKEEKRKFSPKNSFSNFFFHKTPRICDFKKSLKRTKVSSAKFPIIDEDSY